MLDRCSKEPDRICPFCSEQYNENAEYVDIGVGYQQVTANYCHNPDCGAVERGSYDEYDLDLVELKDGWVRAKPVYKYPKPKTYLDLAGHEWWCMAVGKTNEKKWGKNAENCICHSIEEHQKAKQAGYEL